MIANKEQVRKLIPQKNPFVMVDTLLEYSGKYLLSNFEVSNENILVKDGFLTESGIIENMAQSVALHTGYQFFLKDEIAPTGYIGSIKNIEITRKPKLKEVLKTEVNLIQEFMGVTLVEIKVEIGGELIAQGDMKTVLTK